MKNKQIKKTKKRKKCNDCKERELIVEELIKVFTRLEKKFDNSGYTEYLALIMLCDYFKENYGNKYLREVIAEVL